MKKLALFCMLTICCLIVSSCDTDDEANFHFVALKTLRVAIPDSFQLNEKHTITVTYERPDNCTFFEGFEITRDDTTVRNVVAIGTVFRDSACLPEIEEVEVNFDFVVLYDQTYTFRFWQGKDENAENLFFEIEVPVN